MDFEQAFYRAYTGQRRNKQTINGLLNDSKGAFNVWKQVAQESGISERTLRRIRAGGRPGKQTQAKLDALSKRQEVRQAGVKPGRARKLNQATANGARVRIKGNQGPKGYAANDYRRPRTVDFDIPADAVQRLRDAYESGNDAAIKDLVEEFVSDYGWSSWTPEGGWEFGSMDNVEIDPR